MIDRERPQPALDVIGRSAIARGVSSIGRRLEAAGSRSRAIQAVTTIGGAWRAMATGERCRATGVTLMTASAVHLVLTVLNHVPAGWMWLIVPAVAFAQGALLIAASGPRISEQA